MKVRLADNQRNTIMDVDLLRPGTVPLAPDTILWFEFLLDANLLENYLKKKDPDPSATDLIIKFISIQLELINPPKLTEAPDLTVSAKNEEFISAVKKSHKFCALKILSLKVAAFLKWDLGILENKLPLPMQLALLQDLLFLALDKEVDVESHLEMDLETLPEQGLFAITLYHRWVLRAAVCNRRSTKQAKAPPPTVPGLQDPMYVDPVVLDKIITGLEQQVDTSLQLLTRILTLPAPRVPAFGTFIMLSEDSTEVKQNWDVCLDTSAEEYMCQVHFELGRFYFFRKDYEQAAEYIGHSMELYKAWVENHHYDGDESHFCTVTAELLQGFHEALDLSPMSSSENLLTQMLRSVHDQYTGIVRILQEDNIACDIPQVHRDCLELDIQGAVGSGRFTVARDLLLQIATLNAAHRAACGEYDFGDYRQHLRAGGARACDMLLLAFSAIIPYTSEKERNYIKNYLINLSEDKLLEDFAKQVLASDLTSLFSSAELDALRRKLTNEYVEVDSTVDVPNCLLTKDWILVDSPVSNNEHLETLRLEKQLVRSYDPNEINELLKTLAVANPSRPIWRVYNKWELPIAMQSAVMTLPKGYIQDYTYILLAKSRELTAMKDFSGALALLQLAEQSAKRGSSTYKLGRLLTWENTLVRVRHYLDEWPSGGGNSQSLVADCRACINALHSKDSFVPRPEVVENCAACLLNMGEWELITDLNRRWNFFEIGAAIAYACLDIAKYKATKKFTKDAWDIVLPVFSQNLQQKRSSSGASTLVHRDSPNNYNSVQSRASLVQFLERLRDPTVLAVMISLLARLHNVLRDEPSLELSVEYVGVWPAVVSNANSYQARGVCEVLSQFLSHALKYHPTNVSWLKLLADINFVTGHHATALRYFLEVGIVSSNYFSQPLSRGAISNHTYRQMIKCCSLMQCHTQAAVLCQFLDEVDYTTAFKSLGDTKSSTCCDTMDTYYSCIWDVTILEFLIYLHTKRGEYHRRQQAIKAIGLLELNANNNEEIQKEAANIRKSRFLRALARQFVC